MALAGQPSAFMTRSRATFSLLAAVWINRGAVAMLDGDQILLDTDHVSLPSVP